MVIGVGTSPPLCLVFGLSAGLAVDSVMDVHILVDDHVFHKLLNSVIVT